MSRKKQFVDLLLNSKRVALTSPKYFKRLRTLLLLLSAGFLLTILLIFWQFGLEYISLILAGVILISGFIVLRFLSNHIHASAIKGGTLVVTSLSKRNYVTSLRSLNSVKSYHLPGINITRLSFNLDGIERRSIIINADRDLPFSADKVILKARTIYKKQKASL